MLKINTIDGFKPIGNNKRKKQIVLSHTSRNMEDYVKSLRYRYNGDNKKIPHYLIDRDGNVYNLIPPNTYSEFLENSHQNRKSIVINLENLGWLKKHPLSINFVNWIGNVHKEEIYERKWRGHFFWQPYTDKQMDSLSELVKILCNEFNIPKTSIGHNVKIDKIENFNGITSRSNYDVDFTDLNPAFDFDIFINKIEDE
jgi:N-acetyl-anhydromuramyl-L-alanine amidase AmpD